MFYNDIKTTDKALRRAGAKCEGHTIRQFLLGGGVAPTKKTVHYYFKGNILLWKKEKSEEIRKI